MTEVEPFEKGDVGSPYPAKGGKAHKMHVTGGRHRRTRRGKSGKRKGNMRRKTMNRKMNRKQSRRP